MKDIDWSGLSFGYVPTDYNVRCCYNNGKWGEIEVCSDEYLKLHMAATCLHYGQEAFEGLKAFRCPDGKVRVFRMDENAARLQSTCRGIMMPEVPTELFCEMVKKVVRLNQEYIPTYESGASLYIRPLLIGTTAQVGVHPATEYMFLIFVTPVGPYFKGGFSTNPYVIIRDYDRSAPLGTGVYKVGGNYAASLKANAIAHEKGYACEFYLDAKEKKYMDECGAANFFGIKNNTYVTPKSTSTVRILWNLSALYLHTQVFSQLHQTLVGDRWEDRGTLRSYVCIVLNTEEVGSSTLVHVFLLLGVEIELASITLLVSDRIGSERSSIVATHLIDTCSERSRAVEITDNDVWVG